MDAVWEEMKVVELIKKDAMDREKSKTMICDGS